MLDGIKVSTPYTTEAALRRLRTEVPRYVLSERFQTNADEVIRLQFDLKKPASEVAFWRPVLESDTISGDFDIMNKFLIIPNRYTDTRKYFTAIDTSPDSDEIRLLVLPPSGTEDAELLRCEFRNVRLDDPSRPSYEMFSISGPEYQLNDNEYNIEIGGHLCVTSNGMRKGLQNMQDAIKEKLIWNFEMCINCRDVNDTRHLNRLGASQIPEGASSGAILMYDRLSSTTPILNRNKHYKPPLVDRTMREIRLLRFLPKDTGDSIKAELLVRNLDNLPVYKALSYTWGDDRKSYIETFIAIKD